MCTRVHVFPKLTTDSYLQYILVIIKLHICDEKCDEISSAMKLQVKRLSITCTEVTHLI